MNYSKLINRAKRGEVVNNAGGFAWQVDRWRMLDRFLILGSETGTYYVDAEKLTLENTQNVISLIKEEGERVVDRIVDVSVKGLSAKNDAAIYALALAASVGNDRTRAKALESLPLVCRTGTHLFTFAAACRDLRGWGRGLRKAIAKWYNAQDPDSLEYGLVKYQAREGWSHRDLLRLVHPIAVSEKHQVLYKWVVDKELTGEAKLIEAVLKLRTESSLQVAKELIREFNIPREAIPTEMLNEREVWEAMLENMPLTAMLRNLATMTSNGLLTEGILSGANEYTTKVIEKLSSDKDLKKARIHPIAVLSALRIYSEGRGFRGSQTWKPVKSVVRALDQAFYRTFDLVPSTGKRYVLGLDVSGSMVGTMVNGVAGLDCRSACGAMAMLTVARENQVTNLAFDTSVYPLAINRKDRLEKVLDLLAKTGGGGTDCALPILHATKHRIPADVFVIYTDSETWFGTVSAQDAMKQYRKKMGIDAKLVVIAMAATRFSVGSESDLNTLNVVGFDTSVPQVITDFVK